MALDILPFGVADEDVVVGIDAIERSVGCRPAPQTGAMAVNVRLTGTTDGLFDLIVETTDEATLDSGRWYETTSRVNGVTGQDTFLIPVVDPILDKLRLRITRNGGTGDATAAVKWLSDRAGMVAL